MLKLKLKTGQQQKSHTKKKERKRKYKAKHTIKKKLEKWKQSANHMFSRATTSYVFWPYFVSSSSSFCHLCVFWILTRKSRRKKKCNTQAYTYFKGKTARICQKDWEQSGKKKKKNTTYWFMCSLLYFR